MKWLQEGSSSHQWQELSAKSRCLSPGPDWWELSGKNIAGWWFAPSSTWLAERVSIRTEIIHVILSLIYDGIIVHIIAQFRSLIFLQCILLLQWYWANLSWSHKFALKCSFSSGHMKLSRVSQIGKVGGMREPMLVSSLQFHQPCPSSKASTALLSFTSCVLFHLAPPHAPFHSFQPSP